MPSVESLSPTGHCLLKNSLTGSVRPLDAIMKSTYPFPKRLLDFALGAMSYLVDGRVLFTGDMLALRNDHVRTFYRLINVDTATQKASIGKLARLEGVSLLCTAHTGCTTECARAMRHWRGQEKANGETE